MPRPDRIFRPEAIILRRHDFSEADRLLTIFTPTHGKMRAIAKGSRKPRGRKTGHVELFTRSIMMIAHGRELHVVSQAEMVESFMPLREDLERGAYASYFAELLDHFSELEEQNIPLYDLFHAALGWLCAPQVDLRLTARVYELQLLRLVGFQPSFFHCAIGQEEIEAQNQFFSAIDGGAVCPEHAENNGRVITLNLMTLKTLRSLQTRDYPTVSVLHVDAVLHLDMERVLQGYIAHILERKLKSVEFIRRLRHM